MKKRNIKRKLLSLVIIGTVVLSAAACGEEEIKHDGLTNMLFVTQKGFYYSKKSEDISGEDIYCASVITESDCDNVAIFGLTEKGGDVSYHAYDFDTGKSKTITENDKEYRWIQSTWHYGDYYVNPYDDFEDSYDWEVEC